MWVSSAFHHPSSHLDSANQIRVVPPYSELLRVSRFYSVIGLFPGWTYSFLIEGFEFTGIAVAEGDAFEIISDLLVCELNCCIVVLVMRTYAVWGQSRKIFYVLLFISVGVYCCWGRYIAAYFVSCSDIFNSWRRGHANWPFNLRM